MEAATSELPQPQSTKSEEKSPQREKRAQRRVQVNFDSRAVEVLEALAKSSGKPVAEVVRDAVGFYDWARQQQESGKSVAVVDHDSNRVREFLLPFRNKP